MLNIDITYILVFLVSLFVGGTIGWILGKKFYELKRVKRVLLIKNPDMWELEHFVAVEDEEQQKIKNDTKPMAKNK